MSEKSLTSLSADELSQFMREKFPELAQPEAPKPQSRKICIALLAYDGRMEVRNSACITQSSMELAQHGMSVVIIHRDGDSMVARGRSFLASQFLENPGLKDCTDLVFIDVDLAWDDPKILVRLCSHNVDIVAGAYPYKDEQGNFPLRWPATGLMEENGLWEVAAVTPGFLRVSRKALERIACEQPWLEFRDHGNAAGQRCWMFFDNTARITGVFDEGYVFCEHARSLGMKVWLDPDLNLTHIGKKAYNNGTLRMWLDKKAETLTHLEHEFPHVPPLRLLSKAMGEKIDLTEEQAKHEAEHQRSDAGPTGAPEIHGGAHASEHQPERHDVSDLGGRGRPTDAGQPEAAPKGRSASRVRKAKGRQPRGKVRPGANGDARRHLPTNG